MSYLVDANVLSESTRRVPNPRVMGWMARHERELFVDPIVLGEVRLGILKLPRGKKRLALENWFAAVVETFECLPWIPPSVKSGRSWLLVCDRKVGTCRP